MAKSPKVAVMLAGCGHLDGAEIREAVLTLLALDQHGAEAQCIAPNDWQAHVIDHAVGKPVDGERRNILVEASRIARVGKCLDLAKADPADYDALLMPGGYGVAKNHCSFAFKGTDAEVRPDVAAFIGAFFAAKKPLGAICISPALVALCLAKSGQSAILTLGNGKDIQAAMEKLGQVYRPVPSAREIVVDDALNLVTTSAYMFDDARLSDVWVGIERCVAEVLKRA
jgi:enhancing lycopene biosynthesis protein 2